MGMIIIVYVPMSEKLSKFDLVLADASENLATSSDEILVELLNNKRSPSTRRAYAYDIKLFFRFYELEASPENIQLFLSLGKHQATHLVLKFKHDMESRDLAPATIARRIEALRSLVKFAADIGRCDFELSNSALRVKGAEHKYRDTTGVKPQQFQELVSQIDLSSESGVRDRALVQLLWSNALRRGEAIKLDIKDIDLDNCELYIMGKGRQQKEKVGLSALTVNLLEKWLKIRLTIPTEHDALFIALDRASKGKRINDNYVYKLVRRLADKAGIKKVISPHRIRHSSITALLDATNGNFRAVQKLSRHKNIQVLGIYDDNRRNPQPELSEMLDNMLF